MYAGPGSGPMVAAAAAWDGVAAQLHATAAAYSSVISGLTLRWLGPAAATMAAAAAPYMAWISTTAEQAEQAAGQARAAAAAFEAAFAATVPPAAVAANRAQLLALTATNFFGQNTPAIMATQGQYVEMWAQDAAAMYGYAGSAAAASHVMPFRFPPRPVNSDGTAVQAAAVAHATSTAAGHARALPQAMSPVPALLQHLAAPAATAAPAVATDPSAPASLASSLNTIVGFGTGPVSPLSYFAIGGVPELLGAQSYLLPQAGASLADAVAKVAATGPLSGAGWVGAQTTGLGSAASAGMGRAGFIGGLSVPQGWAMAAPAVRPVAAVWSESGVAGAPAAAAAASAGEGSVFGNMALSSLAGRAIAGTGGAAARSASAAAPAAEATGPVNIFIIPAAPQ